jgi:hypothetical protein
MPIPILIELDEKDGGLSVRAPDGMPTAVCLGIIVNAYHELLSKKIREDARNEIITMPGRGLLS